ncbi:MAG: DUF3450 family protein, partial [Methylococcaceae bacterium]|nr:DUF3450 family protein [Methylococcaceae bacterium]
APAVDPTELFRLVVEAYRVELDYGKTVEVTRATLGENAEKLVDFLSVGRLALYYQTLDGENSFLWLNDERRWQKLSSEDNEYISEDLRIARKEVPPGLMILPLPARAETPPKQVQSSIVQTPESTRQTAALAKVDAELAEPLKPNQALFQQIRESSSSLKPFYKNQWLAGDRSGQRLLVNTLAETAHIPKLEELARLFSSLQAQLDGMGRVEFARLPVYLPDGHREDREVLNCGGFSLISDGRYLLYQPETDKLVELARQPSSNLLRLADDFSRGEAGSIHPVAIDPGGGSTLQLVVQVPHLLERIRQGGPVGYLILVLAGFAFPLAGYRLWVLRRVENSIRGQMGNPEIRADNPLGRVLSNLAQVQGADVEVLNLTLDQSLLTEQDTLDRSLPLLRLLAAIAPMLGLLGTVTGMIATFQAIALHGSGDPKLMSGGISEALVTTVEGLVVAIPILLLHSVLVTQGARINTLLAAHGAAAVARRLIGES